MLNNKPHIYYASYINKTLKNIANRAYSKNQTMKITSSIKFINCKNKL